ncbi:hypothetical protein ACJIZ3_006510 [Penstemon smallii]|uniref:Vacuolar protein 8 n=1 Tax=Penstemon smallii TaxID=265156 RepID=A0ABD3S7W5_9LAMI
MGDQENRALEEKPMLQQSIILISSLISLSHSIKVFTTKWQSIRNKLEELLSNLTAIDNCEFTESFSLSITLESILSTLKNCNELAKKCLDFSYTGKLLMQSNLEIVNAKLGTHLQSISDIYAMGLLSQNYAIVVSKPSFSASKDDVKFYINDLLSRFKIGSNDMKKQALLAFNEVIQEDERYLKIAVETDGLINFLVKFLDFQEIDIREEASKSVFLIAGLYKSVLISAGVIPPLIRVLESGNDSSKIFAARCLMKVTENSDNTWSVSAHGGVTALLKICRNKDSLSELVGLACGVLKNLVGVEEIKRFMVEEGAISEFLNLVRSKDEVVQICSLDLLQSMAYGDESIKEMIIQEGGIRAFVRVLDPKSPFSTKTREVAFRGIVNICFSTENILSLLLNYGFMDHILYFLQNGDVVVQELALKAAFWLCGTSEEAKKLMGDAGFMPVLVKFLDSKSFEIGEMAAETLSSLIMVPKNRKKFVQNDQNVCMLLQMLDPEKASSGNKKLLLSILMLLTNSNSARKKIVNSGYLKNIENLAEVEGSDAQKIIRKLNSNRLRSIFTGFWHS